MLDYLKIHSIMICLVTAAMLMMKQQWKLYASYAEIEDPNTLWPGSLLLLLPVEACILSNMRKCPSIM